MSLEEDREALRKEAERQALAQLEKAKVRKLGGAVLALFPLPRALETAWTDPSQVLAQPATSGGRTPPMCLCVSTVKM